MTGAVAILGATQIIGYGTLYYAYPLIVDGAAAEFAVAPAWLFGVFSVGLLVGGLAAPAVGRLIDRHGAPAVMTGGSGLAGLLLLVLSVSPNVWAFAGLIIAIEIVSASVLYDAAFAALALLRGKQARSAITGLTLIAGFASTLFWPLTGLLVADLGWRATYGLFGALHLAVALPLHALLSRSASSVAGSDTDAANKTTAGFRHAPPKGAFTLMAVSFTISAVLISGLGVHLVPLLQSQGLAQSVYLVAMVMGPAQVAIRLVDGLFWRHFHPVDTALIAAAMLPLAVLVLMTDPGGMVSAVLFAALFGFGQGLASIVRGALPLALFGAVGYGVMLGRLAAVRQVAAASAPAAFAVVIHEAPPFLSMTAMAVIGLAALMPLLVLRVRISLGGTRAVDP